MQSVWRSASAWMCCLCSSTQKMENKVWTLPRGWSIVKCL